MSNRRGASPAASNLEQATGGPAMKMTLRFSFLACSTVLLFCASNNAQAQQVPQAPNMSFFVTSAPLGKGGDLGGLAGAEAHCQQPPTTPGAARQTSPPSLSSPQP